jgi:serine/threonine-protein kinase
VTERGQVRLVDFGIARSLQDDDATAIPRFTPRYASPEMASGQSMTTASDVFGLCAVLYELICGLAPRDSVTTTTRSDYRSFMLTPIPNAVDQYDNSTSNREIAAQRATNIRRLKRSLKGDLHWILDLGLKVDASKRLSSAADLRQDLAQYLDGLPVDSHPPSNTYRVRKFLQRHKVAVIVGAAAVVGLSTSAGIALKQAELARQEAEKALWSSSFLMRLFDEADPWRNQQEPITVNELAAAAVVDVLNNRQDLAPDTLGLAASILARVEGRLGHLESSENLLNLRIELLQQHDGDRADLAQALVNLGIVKANQAESGAAIEAYRRAHSLLPIGTEPEMTSANAAIQLAYALVSAQEGQEARELLDAIFKREEEMRLLEGGSELLASTYNTKSSLLLLEGEFIGAREAAEQAIEYAETMDSDVPIMIGKTMLGLSEAFHQAGDSEAAMELDQKVVDIFSSVYGVDHPQTLESQGRLAVSASSLGYMEEAIAAYQDVLKGQIASLGPENQYVAATLGNMGAAYLALDDATMALQYFEQAQTVWESLEPAQPVYIALNEIGVARALHGLQRMQESEDAFSSALSILESTTGTSHPIYSRAEVYRAPLLLDLNRLDEAAVILPGAYGTINEAYGTESRHTALAGLRWAQLLMRIGDPERASELAAQSVAVLDTDANRRRHAADLDEAKELLVTTQQ